MKFVVFLLHGDALTCWCMHADSAVGIGSVHNNLDIGVLRSKLTTQFSDIDCETHLRDKLFSITYQGLIQEYTTQFR